MASMGGGVCLFTEESIGVAVVSIIVDLFARDADAALGREGLRAVRGRERGKYLGKIYVAFMRKRGRVGRRFKSQQKRLDGCHSPTGHRKCKKKKLWRTPGKDVEAEGEKMKADAMSSYIRGYQPQRRSLAL